MELNSILAAGLGCDLGGLMLLLIALLPLLALFGYFDKANF
jgi:hypothetical protein